MHTLNPSVDLPVDESKGGDEVGYCHVNSCCRLVTNSWCFGSIPKVGTSKAANNTLSVYRGGRGRRRGGRGRGSGRRRVSGRICRKVASEPTREQRACEVMFASLLFGGSRGCRGPPGNTFRPRQAIAWKIKRTNTTKNIVSTLRQTLDTGAPAPNCSRHAST